jgi:hypothetical protein
MATSVATSTTTGGGFAKMASLHDLIIGFYSGSAAGSGFTSMSLDVKINGVDSPDNPATFTSVATANSYFQNHAVDFGALSGTSLQLDITLTIAESAAGGYDFGMLIGDPPPAGDAAAHHNLVAAMATFGTSASGSSGTLVPQLQDNNPTLHAGHSA